MYILSTYDMLMIYSIMNYFLHHTIWLNNDKNVTIFNILSNFLLSKWSYLGEEIPLHVKCGEHGKSILKTYCQQLHESRHESLICISCVWGAYDKHNKTPHSIGTLRLHPLKPWTGHNPRSATFLHLHPHHWNIVLSSCLNPRCHQTPLVKSPLKRSVPRRS